MIETPMAAVGEQSPSLVGSPEIEINLIAGIVVGKGVARSFETLVQGAFPSLSISNGQSRPEELRLTFVSLCLLQGFY